MPKMYRVQDNFLFYLCWGSLG